MACFVEKEFRIGVLVTCAVEKEFHIGVLVTCVVEKEFRIGVLVACVWPLVSHYSHFIYRMEFSKFSTFRKSSVSEWSSPCSVSEC